MHLIRRLPLVEGYKAFLPIFSPGGAKMLEVNLEVTKKETLEVPAGRFECYRTEFAFGQGPSFQTFWYSTDPKHYLVKFEGGGAAGELAAIHQRSADGPTEYRDEQFGISLTVPSGWYVHRQRGEDMHSQNVVHFIEPEAVAVCAYAFKKPKDPELQAETGLREAAEKEIIDRQKIFKDYTVRLNSWASRSVAAAPGVSVVADYVHGQEPMVEYLTFMRTKAIDSLFVLRIKAGLFDGIRPTVDKIIDSIQLK